MDKIVTLLNLQKQIRDVKSLDDLAFVAANKTHDLVPYKHAVFWTLSEGAIALHTASGMAKIDKNSPYGVWLTSFLKKAIKKHETALSYIKKEKDGEWLSEHNYYVPFYDSGGPIIGGLWLEVDGKIQMGEADLLKELAECYSLALSYVRLREKHSMLSFFARMTRYKKLLVLGLFLLFFLPVKLSITAPVEIVAKDAMIITMPYDGILERITVNSNDKVDEGDNIALINKTIIQKELDQAMQDLKAAQSSLSRAGLESLRSEEKKQDLLALKNDIQKKKIEQKFAKQRLKETDITALKSGVAIFSDKSVLEGKVLRAGEKIMTIANPDQKELLIRIPSQSLLPITEGQDISFYMNTQPLKGYKAKLLSVGYEASVDPDGLLTYKARAQLQNSQSDLKIGWQGTAKIQSHWSILGYSLLRRPLIAFRNLSGL